MFELLPNNTAIAGLMRHAEKEIIFKDEFGNDVSLTKAGINQCQQLANKLLDKVVTIHSSPVKRCTQTAELLLAANPLLTIQKNHLLGDPGIFIQDREAAHHHFLQHQPFEIVQQLLNDQPNPTGFCHSTQKTVYQLIHFLLKQSTNIGISLFITHDAILSVVLGTLFNEIALEIVWPDYLETLFMWQSEQYLHLVYRDQGKKILWLP